MSKQAQATRNTITLKGSTKVVSEFFAYAVNRWTSYHDAQFSASASICPSVRVGCGLASSDGLRGVMPPGCIE